MWSRSGCETNGSVCLKQIQTRHRSGRVDAVSPVVGKQVVPGDTEVMGRH